MSSGHFPRLAVTTWRPDSSCSHPSLTIHGKSDPRPPPRSPLPPRTASAASLYNSSTSIDRRFGSTSRFGAASFTSLPLPPRTAGERTLTHFASRPQAHGGSPAAEDAGRISLAAHMANLQRPTQLRESAIFLQPERSTFTAPPSGFNDCTSPGYYTADIDSWKPTGTNAQPSATFRAVGRPRVETMQHDSAFRVSMPQSSQETMFRALQPLQPPTSGLVRPTRSSQSKRRQRPNGLRYGPDTVQVRRPRKDPAGRVAAAPVKSPAQLAIERASLSHRLTTSVVLPATHKALAKLEAQGRRFEAKVDYDPGVERQTAWEQANRRAASRRDAAGVVAPNGSLG